MSFNLQKLNKQLNKGILPDCLNFGVQQSDEIDWNKVKYNAFYREYEFFEKKFPEGVDSIPGLSDLIQKFADNAKSPLEEIEERTNKFIDSNTIKEDVRNELTDLPEQQSSTGDIQ